MVHLTQEFNGFIVEVCEKTLWCRMTDMTDPDRTEYNVELKISAIKEEEKPWIQVGAVFNWWLYDDETHDIVFTKEVWTKEEIEQAEKDAKELIKVLGWNNEENQESTL